MTITNSPKEAYNAIEELQIESKGKLGFAMILMDIDDTKTLKKVIRTFKDKLERSKLGHIMPKTVRLGTFKANQDQSLLKSIGIDHHLNKPIARSDFISICNQLGYDLACQEMLSQ